MISLTAIATVLALGWTAKITIGFARRQATRVIEGMLARQAVARR